MTLSFPSFGFILKVAISLFVVSLVFKMVPQLGQFRNQMLA